MDNNLLIYVELFLFLIVAISFAVMYRFLINRKIFEPKVFHWDPLFLFKLYFEFLKHTLHEKNITLIWFFIHIASFVAFLILGIFT